MICPHELILPPRSINLFLPPNRRCHPSVFDRKLLDTEKVKFDELCEFMVSYPPTLDSRRDRVQHSRLESIVDIRHSSLENANRRLGSGHWREMEGRDGGTIWLTAC